MTVRRDKWNPGHEFQLLIIIPAIIFALQINMSRIEMSFEFVFDKAARELDQCFIYFCLPKSITKIYS